MMKKLKKILCITSLFLLVGLGDSVNVNAVEQDGGAVDSITTNRFGPSTYYYDYLTPFDYGPSRRIGFYSNGYYYHGTVYKQEDKHCCFFRYAGTLYNTGVRPVSDSKPLLLK